eukprot:COSAG05_NODE_4069_length_1688_cov_5.717432_3_plen_99_part_00
MHGFKWPIDSARIVQGLCSPLPRAGLPAAVISRSRQTHSRDAQPWEGEPPQRQQCHHIYGGDGDGDDKCQYIAISLYRLRAWGKKEVLSLSLSLSLSL